MKAPFAMSGFRVLSVLALMTWVIDSASGQENTAPEHEQTRGAKEVQQGLGEATEMQPEDVYDRLYGRKVDEQELTPSPTPGALENLLSVQLKDRLQGFEALHRNRERTSKALVHNIKILSRNPSRSLQGRFNMNLVAIARLRINEAIPSLIPMIDFHLDPETFPVGVFSPMYYPVAETLVEIGGRDVAVAVVDLLSGPADPHRLFVSGWVLQEVLGRDAAKAVIVQEMQRATLSSRHRDNLSRVEKLLSKERLSLKGWFPRKVRERLPRLFGDE